MPTRWPFVPLVVVSLLLATLLAAPVAGAEELVVGSPPAGAGGPDRTDDLRFTKPLLYH